MSKYSKAYFNPYSDSFSCRVAIVSPEVLQEAEQRLAEFPGGMESAMKRAMARATAYLRTQSTREIRKKYDISRKAIRAEQNIKVSYRYFNGVEAKISFRGNKIPYSAMAAHHRANQRSIPIRPSWPLSTAIFVRFIRALPRLVISFFQQLRLSLITPLLPQSKQEPVARLIRVFLSGPAGGWPTVAQRSRKSWVRLFPKW